MNSIQFLKLFLSSVFTMVLEPNSMVRLELPGSRQTALVPGIEIPELLLEYIQEKKNLLITVIKGDEQIELRVEATVYHDQKLQYECFIAVMDNGDKFQMDLTLNNIRQLIRNVEFRMTSEDESLSEF